MVIGFVHVGMYGVMPFSKIGVRNTVPSMKVRSLTERPAARASAISTIERSPMP